MSMKKTNRLNSSSIMYWGMIVAVSLSLLFCSSMCLGDTFKDREMSGYTVVDRKGSVSLRSTKTDSLTPVEVNETLLPDQILVIEQGASLKVRGITGEEVVLEGPKKGMLQSLLSSKKTGIREFVKKTLSKIPTAKVSEKKIDISTQSAGLTRGAKSSRKPMPYIWKVKRTQKETNKK